MGCIYVVDLINEKRMETLEAIRTLPDDVVQGIKRNIIMAWKKGDDGVFLGEMPSMCVCAYWAQNSCEKEFVSRAIRSGVT